MAAKKEAGSTGGRSHRSLESEKTAKSGPKTGTAKTQKDKGGTPKGTGRK